MNTQNTLKIITGLALAIGAMPRAQAITGCTNNMLSGAYGWQLSGTLTPSLSGGVAGAVTPPKALSRISSGAPGTVSVAAGLATVFLDGGGNLFGNAVLILDGTSSEGPVTGAYNVNDDCSLSITLTDSGGGTQHFDGVVVNRGDGVNLLQTDPGVGVSGSLRHARGFCQTSDIGGGFGFRSAGTIAASGPFSSIGSINLDGQGNVTASESRFGNGAYSQVVSAGSITVNSDCSLNMTLAANTDGSLVNYRGIILNSTKDMFLLRSDDGATITGTVVAQ
ncbi:MAG TPA: hypothetical protein VGZ73_31745 [Bryobacteraceae bacterium]|jgi:hypothetical protein|nr:hypothetical protein [Bryobacteraceae bacterium]